MESSRISPKHSERRSRPQRLWPGPERLRASWEGYPWNGAALWERPTLDDPSGLHRRPARPLGARPPASLPVPHKHDERLRLFSLNVAHGRRNRPMKPFLRKSTAKRNIHAIAEAVRQLTPDVVALQEADGPSAWSGNFDHVATLAERTELSDHYRGDHNSLAVGRFALASGTALLAREPLLDPVSHSFRMTWRDTKGFVAATIAVPEWDDMLVDVVSVHLDFLNPVIRRKQILQMVDRLIARRRPLVVLGDLNCCFEREPRSMELLVETLGLRAYEPERRVFTYPTRRPRRRLDWILISEELDYSGYHTVHVPLSDHLALVADLEPR